MFRLVNFGLHAVTIVLLVQVLRQQRQLARKEEKLMGQTDDLVAAVQAVAQAEADEEARIDTLIEALKAPHDSPIVGAAIRALEDTRLRLQQFHAGAPADESPKDEPLPIGEVA